MEKSFIVNNYLFLPTNNCRLVPTLLFFIFDRRVESRGAIVPLVNRIDQTGETADWCQV